ncbi:hypothetical protein ABZ329_12610 [Streptomyces rubiginosohelvolus]|uniref:hypothetical protein n=1 Tax=Streptomyces rubiginosohelvolus TaxID=67362 RepID=UPI0033C91F82
MPGWKTVINPKRGIAFGVPADWAVKSSGRVTYIAENDDPEETPPASVGSRRPRHRRSSPGERPPVGLNGSDAQSAEEKAPTGAAKPFTTESGLAGSVATATATGVDGPGRCAYDGEATAFAFDSPAGETLSWTFVGVRGVDDQVPEPTVRKILGTVRLVDSTP